jgi:hypothetical protein
MDEADSPILEVFGCPSRNDPDVWCNAHPNLAA